MSTRHGGDEAGGGDAGGVESDAAGSAQVAMGVDAQKVVGFVEGRVYR